MFRRRGSPGADGAEGASLVARAAWAFVTPALVLLIYVLGKPVRDARCAGPPAHALCVADPRAGADILVTRGQVLLPARPSAGAGAPGCAPRAAPACAVQRSRARARRPQRLCCPARGRARWTRRRRRWHCRSCQTQSRRRLGRSRWRTTCSRRPLSGCAWCMRVRRGPAAADAALRRKTPQRHALQNVILVTWANDHYFDFVMNWVTNLQRVNVTNYMVGAMDDDLLHRLIAERVPTWAMQSGLTVNDFGWGTATFHKMGRSKIDLIYKFVSMVRARHWRGRARVSHACHRARRASTFWCRMLTPFGCETRCRSCCAILTQTYSRPATTCQTRSTCVVPRARAGSRVADALPARRMTALSGFTLVWALQTSASCLCAKQRCPWWTSGTRYSTKTRRFGTKTRSTTSSGGASARSCPTGCSWRTTCVPVARAARRARR